jgi:hypothetical protein
MDRAIFFDRATDTLTGIFSVPALGGPERLVVADAGFPVALENGDLLMKEQRCLRILHWHRQNTYASFGCRIM